jgi:replicative DNA helicase
MAAGSKQKYEHRPARVDTGPRVPPQDLDAERALLGAIMLSANTMYDVADIVTADAFYAAKHGTIFDGMLSLYSKGEPIDVVSLSNKLKSSKQLDTIGGGAYLSELVTSAPAASNAQHYAQIVQTKYMLRSLIEAARQISDLGFDETREVESVLDEAQAAVFAVANSPTLRKFITIKDALSEAWERLDMLSKQKGALRGVPSGFAALDNMLAGFQKSDLIILAARPSMGKTAFALDIARQTAVQHGTPVGIFSLEMSSQQLVDRMLASQAKVEAWKLRTGRLSGDDEFERLQQAMGVLNEAPIYIDDQAGNSVLTMRSIARRLKSEKDLGLIIVDYLQLITPTSSRNSDSVVQQITEISRSLKGMARELDVPVIALSQLSRAVEQRRGRPRLSDLRDSGAIEQDADVVMFIHREDKMTDGESDRPNIAEILVEKHRNGAVGSIELFFDANRVTFLPIEKGNFEDFAPPQEAGVSEDAPW